MKRTLNKYFAIVIGLLAMLILYFVYDAQKQYRQQRMDRASEELNISLDYEDVEAFDEAWENINRAMVKADIDTIIKK